MSYAYTFMDDQGPIYVGKGTGARWSAHMSRPEFRDGRNQLLVVIDLCDSEEEAMDLEAELYRQHSHCGRLINKIVPRGSASSYVPDQSRADRLREQLRELNARLSHVQYSRRFDFNSRSLKLTAQMMRNDVSRRLRALEKVTASGELEEVRLAKIARLKAELRAERRSIDDHLACSRTVFEEACREGRMSLLGWGRWKENHRTVWNWSGLPPIRFLWLTERDWKTKARYREFPRALSRGI